MTLRYSSDYRNARLNTILNSSLGVDYDGGTLSIYTGSQPASADNAPSGTLLAQITLPAPSWGAAASGVITKSGTWQDTSADATGTMGWFRLAAGARNIDGSITATGGGGDMEFDDITVEAGQGVTITTFTLTEPSSSGAVKYSTGWRNQRLEANFNGGSGTSFDSGTLEIRSGSPPSSANDAETGTLLASITLPADAFGSASSASAAKAGTWQDTSADASGTMGWFRLKRSGDAGGSSTTAIRVDGTITATGGGGVLTFDDITPVAGQIVTITTFTFTEPAS